MIFWLWLLSFDSLFTPAWAQELTRSSLERPYWIEFQMGQSPDSEMFHAGVSAVGDRRDFTLRYQRGTLGWFINRHTVVAHSDLDQEAYELSNTILAVGAALRFPLSSAGGLWGESNVVVHAAFERGVSDYHYFEGQADTTKPELKADRLHNNGYALGADVYYPLYFGLWLSGGLGFETMEFNYRLPNDANGDGVNLHGSFTYFRLGLSLAP